MNMSINELIDYASQALLDNGYTQDYVKNLSYTWNGLKHYLIDTNQAYSETTGNAFLRERYAIETDRTFAKLSAINKRRRRAIHILTNCLMHDVVTLPKSYSLCRFSCYYKTELLDFVEFRKQQDFSLSTLNRDICCLNRLSIYLDALDLRSLTDLNSAHLVGFVKYLSVEEHLPTLKGFTSTLRLLMRHLYKTGIQQTDLSEFVPKVKPKTDGIPSVYTPDEIESMLNHFNRTNPKGIRDYAMVLLAVRLGMRASDICSLKFENIDWQANTISFIAQKNQKSAVLPLISEVGHAIIDYLQHSRPETTDKHIFVRLQKPFRELQPSGLHTIVTQAIRNAGIIIPSGKRHGPHALRASLATEMLAHNTPLPIISETLTHTCTDTTKIYLKVDVSHLRQCSLEVPPLGNVWMGGFLL